MQGSGYDLCQGKVQVKVKASARVRARARAKFSGTKCQSREKWNGALDFVPVFLNWRQI